MKKLTLYGAEVNCNKVGLTVLLRCHAGYGLAAAKHITDRVLAGEEVVVNVPDENYDLVKVRSD